MKTLPSASLASYQSGARAARAKAVGSLALGAAALGALSTAAEAQTIATGPGLQNNAGDSPTNLRVTTLNMTTGLTGLNTGSRVGPPAGTWDVQFTSYSTGNSSENSYLLVGGLNAGFGAAQVAISNNGLTSNLLSNLSLGTTIGPGGSLTFSGGRANEYFYTPNLGTPNLKTPQWSNVTGYFGVEVDQADGTHYGWVKLTTTDGGADITIDTLDLNPIPDESIGAGQAAIPEPASTALLLAAGAAGLAIYRRRKNIQRAA